MLKQTTVRQEDVKGIRKGYDKNKGTIDSSTFVKTIGAGAVATTAVVASGAAFVFALGIAVALAGGAFSGLHGAALTSASRALFGGGPLAAGGFGVAGGTAVIAGGGALLGLVGSGTVSDVAAINIIPNEYRVTYLTKLLTYVDHVVLGVNNDQTTANYILKYFRSSVKKIESQVRELKDEKNDLNKEAVEKMETYLKCLKNAERVLGKMVNR